MIFTQETLHNPTIKHFLNYFPFSLTRKCALKVTREEKNVLNRDRPLIYSPFVFSTETRRNKDPLLLFLHHDFALFLGPVYVTQVKPNPRPSLCLMFIFYALSCQNKYQ